jgi:hypothetical protein
VHTREQCFLHISLPKSTEFNLNNFQMISHSMRAH